MTDQHFVGSMTLKALLEDPNLKNPPIMGYSSNQIKVKKESDGDQPQYNYGSAFLGPNLWDRNVVDTDFNLEYMDLEEFLSENSLPIATEDVGLANNMSPMSPKSEVPSQIVGSPRQFLKTPPVSPSQFHPKIATPPHVPVSPHYAPGSPPNPNVPSGSKSPTPPVSPFAVDYQVSEQDLALASIPDYGDDYLPKWQAWTDENGRKYGQEGFDPRKRNFTEDELKPQPIIKKSKKVFVPEDLKDEKYWARRVKNNYAAKRSRDARRVKENQIAMRAAFLEKENGCLRDEMSKLRKENARLKSKLDKYEGSSTVDDLVSGLSLP